MPPNIEAKPTAKPAEQQGTQLDLGDDAGTGTQPAVQPDPPKTEEQINAENAERMAAKFAPLAARRPVPDDNGALPTERQSVPAGPKPRGNTALRVKGGKQKPDGSWPMRVPDTFDVIHNGEIIGRHPDPAKREAILKAAQ